MTEEQAINVLLMVETHNSLALKAKIMAIEALKQKSCDDAISRKALLELMGEEPFNWTDSDKELQEIEDYRNFRNMVEQLPSVKPQESNWVPISERLPEENKTVIASTKYGVYPETKYTKEYGWQWAYESGADYWKELEDVAAWMPLPKRYEPQEGSK